MLLRRGCENDENVWPTGLLISRKLVGVWLIYNRIHILSRRWPSSSYSVWNIC